MFDREAFADAMTAELLNVLGASTEEEVGAMHNASRVPGRWTRGSSFRGPCRRVRVAYARAPQMRGRRGMAGSTPTRFTNGFAGDSAGCPSPAGIDGCVGSDRTHEA